MADYKSTHTGEQIDTAIDNANSNWSLLMANLGIGRWRQTHLFGGVMYDDLAKYYTNINYYLAHSGFYGPLDDILLGGEIHFNNPTDFFNKDVVGERCFVGMQNTGTFYLPTCTLRGANLFQNSKWSKILVEDGCECKIVRDGQGLFENCPNLVEVGTFDMSGTYDMWGRLASGSTKLKTLHCKHWRVSFNISTSTAFEEADLVEIISNLDTLSGRTLTMGTTNLAKLTDEEKKVATDKGWVLA